MRVIKFYILFQLFNVGNLFSQPEKVDFKLLVPQKIPFSYYKYIRVMDMRKDTGNIGFVITKGLNNTALVVPEISLQDQIQNILYFCADSIENGELLLQIRKIKFIQQPTTISEEGYFLFRAVLFNKEDGIYKQIENIDTLIVVSKFDKAKNLKIEASYLITNFLLKNASKKGSGISSKSYYELLQTDSIEKSKLKLYNNTEQYTDGIYLTFNSFKNQVPDHVVSKLTFGNNGLKKVKTLDKKGKKITLESYDVFAVIDKSKIYISTEFGYRTLFKFNGEFYFVGEGEITHTDFEVITASMLGGAIGAIRVSNAKKVLFQIWLDHVDGSFIRGRRVN